MIIVTCPETVFGEVVRTFETESEALAWVAICEANKVRVIVAREV